MTLKDPNGCTNLIDNMHFCSFSFFRTNLTTFHTFEKESDDLLTKHDLYVQKIVKFNYNIVYIFKIIYYKF